MNSDCSPSTPLAHSEASSKPTSPMAAPSPPRSLAGPPTLPGPAPLLLPGPVPLLLPVPAPLLLPGPAPSPEPSTPEVKERARPRFEPCLTGPLLLTLAGPCACTDDDGQGTDTRESRGANSGSAGGPSPLLLLPLGCPAEPALRPPRPPPPLALPATPGKLLRRRSAGAVSISRVSWKSEVLRSASEACV